MIGEPQTDANPIYNWDWLGQTDANRMNSECPSEFIYFLNLCRDPN